MSDPRGKIAAWLRRRLRKLTDINDLIQIVAVEQALPRLRGD